MIRNMIMTSEKFEVKKKNGKGIDIYQRKKFI